MTVVHFDYRAARPDGRIVRGTLAASDREAAKRRLAGEGLSAIGIEPRRRWSELGWVRRRDVAVVFRNVALLVGEGIPIERAFATSEALVQSRVRRAIEDLRATVKEGATVAEAMGANAAVFPCSLVGIMRAGERGSRLPEACEMIADQLETDVRLRAELWSALTYPLLVLVVGVGSVVVMGAVVVPRFAEVFAGVGSELPPATRVLLAGSDLMRRYGLPATLLTLVLSAVTLRWVRTDEARAQVDRLLLVLPVVGPLRMGFASARTCRALGSMLITGMPLLQALDAAAESTGDAEVTRRFRRARNLVVRGGRLTDSLIEERVLTSFALQLVGVGESSGKLGAMLLRAGDIIADRTRTSLRALVSLVEPMLIVALGGLVAGVAAALLQAVYAVRP